MMVKEFWLGTLLIFLLGLVGFYFPFQEHPSLSPSLARKMRLQIWQNECAGKKEGLTTWNQGEDFASLGIGHFIWYPEGTPQRFKESFPELISFFKIHKAAMPDWLAQAKGCPWRTREEFQAAQNQEDLQGLREFLAQHIDLQILFLVKRLNRSLPTLLKHAPQTEHQHLTYQFYRLAHTPGGLFVLLDYLNFKGEGIASHESYQGQGWGLLQVLLKMQGTEPGTEVIEEFIASAKMILSLRVENSLLERGEARWLKGWHNRVEGYRRISKILDQESSHHKS